MSYSNQDDTPLTNEMLDLLCDSPPDGPWITQRGFRLPQGTEPTWLGICIDFSFGVETDQAFVGLGHDLNTLGKLRELCHVLNIKLYETRLIPNDSQLGE